MDAWLRVIVIVICSVLGSSGLWGFIMYRGTRGNATTRLMMGMAYTQLTTLGIDYINRGSITMDELEDYRKYFYEPYKALGGNGVAERVMGEVDRLPIRSHTERPEIFGNHEGFIHNVRVVARTGQDATT